VSPLWVFLAALVTALATGLGALPFLLGKHPKRHWLGLANSLAAGFMIGASAGLAFEGVEQGAGARRLARLPGRRPSLWRAGCSAATATSTWGLWRVRTRSARS
jgi:hypothetical protein